MFNSLVDTSLHRGRGRQQEEIIANEPFPSSPFISIRVNAAAATFIHGSMANDHTQEKERGRKGALWG